MELAPRKTVRFREEALPSRTLAVLRTGPRHTGRVVSSVKDAHAEGRTDLDSHADTCVLGSNFDIFERTGQFCSVSAFSPQFKPTSTEIVSGRTAWDCPSTGETVILVVHQGLDFFDHVSVSLLCPNQLRVHGCVVDDAPTSMVPSSTHSITAPDLSLRLPLVLDGVMSYLPTRFPTPYEVEHCSHVTLTSSVSWDPYSQDFARQEAIAHCPVAQAELLATNSSSLREIFSLNCTREACDAFAGITDDCCELPLCEYDVDTFCRSLDRITNVSAARSTTRHTNMTPADLSRRWGIGLEAATQTIAVTTQRGLRTAVHPIHKRYRTKNTQLRYNHLNTIIYSDTMFASTKSIRGNTCAQVFVNNMSFSKLVPMRTKGEAGQALSEFFQTIGIPSKLHTDGAKEQSLGTWKKVREEAGNISQTIVEPHSPWQNRAESEIRELKKQTRRVMTRTRAHLRLWDYCAEWVSETRCRTAHPLWTLHGRTPYETVTGNTPDISEWMEFDWYQPVRYHDSTAFPEPVAHLGRWLGISHRVGQAMCYWILPVSGVPISRTTVQAVPLDEQRSHEFEAELKAFDQSVSLVLARGDNDTVYPQYVREVDNDINPDEDDMEPYDSASEKPDADLHDAEAYDNLLSAEVLLPRGDTHEMAKVIKRKRDSHGNPIGRAHDNAMLDSRIYEVQFSDGTEQEYMANLIAESLYSQVDADGNQYLILQEIIDHKKGPTALSGDDCYTTIKGKQHLKRTTQGWKLLVQWRDGTTTWIALKDLKESNPVQVAEYATLNQIADEPAFSWWVPYVLKKRNRILAKVKSRTLKKTHKFGIQVPTNVNEALAIDRATGTDFWAKALNKEMTNVMPAFKILEGDETVPVGYQFIKCHLIFDIKMDFTRKVRFVAGGHLTQTPATLTYSSVVSRESVRIAFLIAALHDLDVLMADIGNAYLNAQCRERVWMIAGKEFGSHEGKHVLIVRALYGLKSSGAAWRSHLAQTMLDLNFKSCLADPDVWMRAATKPDGFKYYEYILIYVDDILAISHAPEAIMKTISGLYRLKEDPRTKKGYSAPERYLGANIGKYRLPKNGKEVWFMSADSYVEAAIGNVEIELEKANKTLGHRATSPMQTSYRPELDSSPALDPDRATYYQNLIGILRWAVELGRIDIHVHVALLSQYLAHPRQGHMDQVLHIFSYLKAHKRSKTVLDDSWISWNNRFQTVDWHDFYTDAKEAIPGNAPEARGHEVQINCFVDADHAGNSVTRRSHTGILIYINSAPITWYSKRQNTVESSTFGSEFVALKTATEMIMGLRYKLRMMGIAIDGPSNVFCDNQSVVTNSSVPESTLKKKHVSICYHRVREACAAKIIRVCYENTKTNLADCLTKNLPGEVLKNIITRILF